MHSPGNGSRKRTRAATGSFGAAPFGSQADACRRRSRGSDVTAEVADVPESSANHFSTPLRRELPELSCPFDAPAPRCRSASTAASDTDGLTSSDNSIHFVDFGLGAHTAFSGSYGEDGGITTTTDSGPVATPSPLLTDSAAQQWQRDLTQFFTRLDRRPLCVVPVSQAYNTWE